MIISKALADNDLIFLKPDLGVLLQLQFSILDKPVVLDNPDTWLEQDTFCY